MGVSVYTDPGSHTEEVVNQGAVTLGTVPLAVALFGAASAFRVFQNEAVIRGGLKQTLVVTGSSPGPYTAPLTVPSNQNMGQTQVLRDGNPLPNIGFSYGGASSVTIAPAYYKSTSVYTIVYVAPSSVEDLLLNSGVAQITRVGSFQGVTSFNPGIDYAQDVDSVNWGILTEAVLTGIPTTPFDLSTNKNIAFSLDGLPILTVDCHGATASATTAAEVVAALNAAMNASISYGAAYAAAASVSTGHVGLTSQVPGKTGSVVLKAAATLSAHLAVFGIATIALPLTVVGTGQEPALGSTYYVTYEIARPSTDYNQVFQFFSPAAGYAILGFPDLGNDLANYMDICFSNGSPSVYCVIAEPDEIGGGISDASMITALGMTETKQGMTEIVPISTSLNVQIATFQSVTNMSSLTEKKRRRGWYGMARNTAVGDINTPNTLMYLAGVTLQVPGDSPGRGRSIVTAPSECTRTITLQDGVSKLQLQLDGTALAAATAAVLTSFLSAATALEAKTLAGFDSITDVTDPARKTMAPGGINVVSLVGGVLTLRDPITTEAAGGGLNEFEEVNVMVQKDKMAFLIDQAIEDNLEGIVPEDLADFISDIKEVVAVELKAAVDIGDIGKYTNAAGVARDISLTDDIQAFQSATDKTQFGFRYWFNGKYAAKRFFGQFSVDNPFFVSSQGG